MRVVVASTFVPFIKGGGTKIVEDLAAELAARGFEVETVLIPFHSAWPAVPGQTLGLRLLDVADDPADRLVTIRYPAYALPHPNKVAWFIHHHREAYDLWGTRYGGMPDDARGRHYRDLMRRSDDAYLRECRRVYTNSAVVAARVRRFNALEPAGVLYPPLSSDHPFRPGGFGDYILYASRLTEIKRQALAIEAMRHVDPGVRLVVCGAPDAPGYDDELKAQAAAAGVADRVEFTGWVSEGRKAELMANCCGALYLAFDEDSYGYVTLEAFHSHKPVVTLSDSGGSLEVVRDGENGYVCPPEPVALADAMSRLWRDRGAAGRMGAEAHRALRRHRIDWDHVIENLTA